MQADYVTVSASPFLCKNYCQGLVYHHYICGLVRMQAGLIWTHENFNLVQGITTGIQGLVHR